MAKKIALLHISGKRDVERKYKTKFSAFFVTAVILFAIGLQPARAAGPEYLIPGGEAVGICVEADGVIIAEITGVDTAEGAVTPARDAGLKPGDVIIKIGTNDVKSGEDLLKALTNADDETTVQVRRGQEVKQMRIKPAVNQNGQKSIGVLARDKMAGVGTITFYDSESETFGALGHEICDADTQILFPLKEGNIMRTEITQCVKADGSTPGRLYGVFTLSDSIGEIEKNCVCGIYGELEDKSVCTDKPLPVADAAEIKPGEAKILSTVDSGGVKEYDIEITRIYPDSDDETRNLMIKITDEDLIEKTGGIVQGMSGSPIIQDGKLIGAVTHVLVNDSSRGYGIFIENMLDAAA